MDDEELLMVASAINIVDKGEDLECQFCIFGSKKTSDSETNCLIGEPFRWPRTLLGRKIDEY